MHPAARHQASEDPEGLCALYAAEDNVEVSMGEYDASSMQHTGIRKISLIHSTEAKLLDNPRVVLRLFRRPRVNSFASRHVSWPAMPSIKASPLEAAKSPTVRPKYVVAFEVPWRPYTALEQGS